jgi:hypothetical protein
MAHEQRIDVAEYDGLPKKNGCVQWAGTWWREDHFTVEYPVVHHDMEGDAWAQLIEDGKLRLAQGLTKRR